MSGLNLPSVVPAVPWRVTPALRHTSGSSANPSRASFPVCRLFGSNIIAVNGALLLAPNLWLEETGAGAPGSLLGSLSTPTRPEETDALKRALDVAMEAGNKASQARDGRRKLRPTKSFMAATTGGASTSSEGEAQHDTTG